MSIDAVNGLSGHSEALVYAKAQQSELSSAAQAAGDAEKAADEAKMREACKGFEAMFLNLMYEKMRSTVPDNPLFGKSNGEKIMQSMLDSEMTKNVADSGGIGLADLIYNQLSQDNKNRIDYQEYLDNMKNNASK